VNRPASELISPDDALPALREWIAKAPFPVEVLAAPEGAGARALEALQITTRSPLGALAFHTGGLLVDHGWLRILGAGCPRLPRALDAWNGLGGERRCAEGLLVGDDAMGGFYAWFQEPRTVHYLAPDTAEWLDMGLGHGQWIGFCLTERLTGLAGDLRWEGWQAEVEALDPARGLLVLPPLWSGGPAIAQRSRKAVPVEELWSLALETEQKLRGMPDGVRVALRVKS
jgi:hypothetical protein